MFDLKRLAQLQICPVTLRPFISISLPLANKGYRFSQSLHWCIFVCINRNNLFADNCSVVDFISFSQHRIRVSTVCTNCFLAFHNAYQNSLYLSRFSVYLIFSMAVCLLWLLPALTRIFMYWILFS